MTMLRRPAWPGGTVALLCAIFVASASGCAWRMNGNEHYLGPVLFRYRVADESGVVNQIVRLGLSINAPGRDCVCYGTLFVPGTERNVAAYR